MKNKRLSLNYSQQDIADKIPDLTRANYSSIERGRTEPSINQMMEIAKVLKVKPEVIFFKDFCDDMEQNKENKTKQEVIM